jgi:hypothetical protein
MVVVVVDDDVDWEMADDDSEHVANLDYYDNDSERKPIQTQIL